MASDERNRFWQARENYNDECAKPEERITQEKLADMLKCNKSAISRIEHGGGIPSISVIQKYCELFGVSADYLFGIETKDINMQRNRTYKDLGLSDSAVETLRLIAANSTGEENILALVNAFIGNKEKTLLFLQQVFNYLKSKDSGIANTAKLAFLATYLDEVLKPQLGKQLETAQRHDDNIANLRSENSF